MVVSFLYRNSYADNKFRRIDKRNTKPKFCSWMSSICQRFIWQLALVLLNKPHSKLGQQCPGRCLILTRCDNRGRACIAFLCAKHTPLNNGESHLFSLICQLKEYSHSILWISNMCNCKWN